MLHQIQVEVHKVPGEVALNFFDDLEAAGYLRYHKEANIQFGSSCIEYGMVKVRLLRQLVLDSTYVSSSQSRLFIFQGVYGFHEWKESYFQRNKTHHGRWSYCQVIREAYVYVQK